MKIRVIAKTDKGETAIQCHVQESIKIGRLRKAMLKQLGISQCVTCTNPYILEVHIKDRLGAMIKPDHIKLEIVEALNKNGAVMDDDYIVEVE